MKSKILILLIFTLTLNPVVSQEWKNLKSYQKETGNLTLNEGCWLKKDRKQQTEIWKKANLYNLAIQNGNEKYKTISQIRDFYLWFDYEREKQGHEIKWIGIAEVVAGQLSKMDIGIVRFLIIRDKDVVRFGNEGSKKVFEFAFPQLRKVYFSDQIIKGSDADNWDREYGLKEQCLILEPIYKTLSPKVLCKLERMVKGKGIYALGVSKKLKYEGNIEDCKARFAHGLKKIYPYRVSKKNKKRYCRK